MVFETVIALAVPLAWLLDARFGEPANAWHPVAWIGRLLSALGRRLRGRRPAPALVGGALAWLAMAGALLVGSAALQSALLDAPAPMAVVLLALALKPMFAWRMLRDEVAAVEACLSGPRRVSELAGHAERCAADACAGPVDAGDRPGDADDRLEAARGRLARLVSRDVAAMDESALRETAIETLAENLNDSVIAPLFWYALAGLPGAVLYRFANTADAAWGYRGEWEWAGKCAARADDLLSWLPARVTAALLLPVPRSWRDLRTQAKRTPSPNGGWPMGAMALRLGVRLTKPGAYALNECADAPRPAHAIEALRLGAHAATTGMLLAAFACLARAPWA